MYSFCWSFIWVLNQIHTQLYFRVTHTETREKRVDKKENIYTIAIIIRFLKGLLKFSWHVVWLLVWMNVCATQAKNIYIYNIHLFVPRSIIRPELNWRKLKWNDSIRTSNTLHRQNVIHTRISICVLWMRMWYKV